ncbi:2-hydroxyacid dehydrogenase [Rhodomicrobium lacus]|uniref:2-hydroxyacid dehydrogenase n=1 Tax=Rhodomicrobium lacus TaxID=2498452 RepID=UPI0026E2D1C6|nr:D-glycerate dehydrogenase [Rhodomicrobium lacus]WKW50193.1 D-glycerate dehydrogenase [Rhodomicrobium lacus]
MTKPKLLMTRVLSPATISRARRDYDLDLNEADVPFTPDELVARAAGKDALLITLADRFGSDVIARLDPSVKVIATYSVGHEHIDLQAAKARGIRVAYTPDAVTVATAEIGFLLILGAARRASEGERLLRAKAWRGWQPMQLIGRRLDGKRLGIYGMGKIGQAIAKRARGFDMDIHYFNRRRLDAADEQGATWHATLDSLLAVADILCIAAPSTPETRGSINAAALARLKPGAIVTNIARGDLVVDDDLIAAVKSGHIAHIGLDVYANEPNIHPGYYDLENAFLLPHMGTSVIEARDEMGRDALDNIDAILAGREPPTALV